MAAFAAVISCLYLPGRIVLPLYFLLPALASLSISVSVFPFSCRHSIRWFFMLALYLTFALSLGLYARAAAHFDAPCFGIRADRIEILRGHLTRDPGLGAGGGGRIRLRLSSCASAQGLSATAQGCMELYFSQAGPLLEKALGGAECSCRVRLVSGEGKPPRFIPRSGSFRITGRGGRLYRWRERLLRASLLHIHRQGAAAPLLEALLIGRKSDPSNPVYRLFRRAGASHILALSGMHLGILSALLLLFVRRFFGSLQARLVILPLLLGYLLFVGIRPSLLRALLFFLFVSWKRFRRRPLFALLVSFLLQLVMCPLSVHELSFQLSYMALFGILTLSSFFRSLLFFLPRFLAVPAGVSLSALCATAVLSLASFGELRPASLLSSLLLSLPVLLLIWLGIGSFLFCSFSPLLSLCSRSIEAVAEFCAALPAVICTEGQELLASSIAFGVLTTALLLRYILPNGYSLRLRLTGFYIRLLSQSRLGDAEKIRPKLPDLSGDTGKDHSSFGSAA